MSDNTEQQAEEQTQTEEQPTEQQPQEPQNLSERPQDPEQQAQVEELILGKFKSQEDLEKGYKELEKFVGGNKEQLRDEIINELSAEAESEVPEEYDLPSLPEGITEADVLGNPLTEWWKSHCIENAYDQEMFENGVNAYIDVMSNQQPNFDNEFQKLGENANARIDAADNFAQSYFSPDQYAHIQETLGQTAEGIEIIETIMNMRNENISLQQPTEPINKLTLDDVRSMMKDPRYFDQKERDPAYVKRVDDAFNRLYR